MENGRLGTVFVEISLDKTKFEKQQQSLLNDIKKVGAEVEGSLQKSFQNLGVKTDTIYQLMADKAIKSYERITQAASASAAEQYRAQALMVGKINALNQEMNKNPLYETLGIRSVAAIEAQRQAVISAFNTISQHVQKGSQDWTNIERAKNDQLKKLNAEMVGEHEMSMASMTRAVLRFYAAYYVISAAIQAVSSAFQGGMKIVEDYNQSVASLAAMAVTFSEKGSGVTLEQSWEKALKYSTAMIPILEEIAAKTILSGTETTALANAFARSGVFLDGNNQKQIEAFTRISNALPLMTQGQEIMRQINTEIRSVMTGSNEASSMMLQTLKALPGFSMEVLKSWREQGTVLEHLGELLEGFGPATKILEIQWTAVKSTLETTVDQILRGGMKPVYEDIIALVKDMDKWLKENKATIQIGIVTAWELVKNTTSSVSGILSGFSPIMKDFGKLTWEIAYGWGGIAAVSKPVSNAIGDSIEKMLIAAKMLIAYSKLGADVLLVATTGGLAGTDLVKSELATISDLQTKYDKIGTGSTLDAIDKELYAYQQKIDAYKNGEKAKSEAANASLMATESDTVRLEKIRQRIDAERWLRESDNATIVKENVLNALKDQLRGQEEYKKQVIAYGKEAAEAWVNADAARIQSEEKKANKADNKDAIYEAKEYAKSIEDVTNEYYRLTMAEDENAKRKIWQDWEGQAAKMSDYALAARDMQLQEIDLYGKTAQARQKAAEAADKERIALIAKNQTMQKEFAVSEKALNNLEQKIHSSGQYAAEWDNAMSIIERALDAGVIGFDEFIAKQAEFEAFQKNTALSGVLQAIEEIDGLYSDHYDTAFEQVVKSEADILEVKMKAAGVYFDKMKWIQEQLANHAGGKELENYKLVADGLGALADNFNAIKGFYAEGTDSFKQWEQAAQAMMIAEKAVAVVSAVKAVIMAAGAPWPAGFVSMVAMAGAMASLLGSIGTTMGGGGSTSTSYTAASVQGSSGVLGAETGTGSESIANSYALMQDTYDMTDTKLTRIYEEIRDLNSNITGLVTSIVRTGGVGTAEWDSEYKQGYAADQWTQIWGSGDLIGKALGGLGEKLIGYIFGGGSKTTLQWTGIELGNNVVGELIKGVQVSARQFASFHKETDTMFGGTDNERWTEYMALDKQVSDALTMVFKSMGTTLVEISKGLGQDINLAMDYIFKTAQIDLKGKTTEEMNKTLNEYFSGVMDTAVYDLFGKILIQYQKIDEGLMETAIRIINDKETILNMLEMTGQGFHGTDLEAIALSETLINLAGDLETLTDAASTYYDKFFSDAEKQVNLQKQLSEALTSMNMALPDTRAGYRALVESLDMSTDSGKAAYVALIKMSGAADEYYKGMEKAAESFGDWAKKLVQPLFDLGLTMYEWGQGIVGMTESQIALSTLMIYRATKGWSASGLSDVLNFEGMSQDDAEAYVTQLTKYAQTVIGALEATYEALQSTKDAIDAQISEITIGGMSDAAKSDYLANQIQAGYAALVGMSEEDVPKAIEKVRSDLTSYYDLQKQLIKDKYDTENELINKKHQDEIANIQAVRDKLLSLTYSSYNLALPTAKAGTAMGDYDKLLASAKTGDAASVSKYLSFTDTALQANMDANKSSQAYLDFYAKVMADIAGLDTAQGQSVESLTATQNDLIEKQTAKMTAELQKLDTDMVLALNMLSAQTYGPMTETMNRLVAAFEIVRGLVAAGYAADTSTINGQTVQTQGLTSGELSAYSSNPQSFLADGVLTLSEASVAGFVTLHDDQSKLYSGLEMWQQDTMDLYDRWNNAFAVWYDRDGAFQEKLYDGLVAWAVRSTDQLDRIGSKGGFNDPEIKSLLTTLVVQGSKKQQVKLNVDGKTFTGYIETVADRLDYDRQNGTTGRKYR